MPSNIRTGYAGYCTAAAGVFGEYVLESDPEIAFGSELFGPERFYGGPLKLHRAWELKDSKNGRTNRNKIFQEYWLGEDGNDEIKEANARKQRLNRQIKAISKALEWVKGQTGNVQSSLRDKHVGEGASLSAYRSCLATMRRSLREIAKEMASAKEDDADHATSDDNALFDSLDSALSSLSSRIDALAPNGSTVYALRAALKTLDEEDLTQFASWLISTKDNLSRERDSLTENLKHIKSPAECRKEAVEHCIASMMAEDASPLWEALQDQGPLKFMRAFTARILPSIEKGFQAECYYSDERIDYFHREMVNTLNGLEVGTRNSLPLFEAFLKTLVGSLIYGPESTGTLEGTRYDEDYAPIYDEDLEDYVGNAIVLTQQLSPDDSLLGQINTYHQDDIVFIGRCTASEVYLQRLEEELSPHELAALDLSSKNPVVFSIPWAHKQVSNLHGMIAYGDGCWWYRDFSRFGTKLAGRGRDGESFVVPLHNDEYELDPGSILFLGSTDGDMEGRLFFGAAVIRVSYYLDTDMVASIL